MNNKAITSYRIFFINISMVNLSVPKDGESWRDFQVAAYHLCGCPDSGIPSRTNSSIPLVNKNCRVANEILEDSAKMKKVCSEVGLD